MSEFTYLFRGRKTPGSPEEMQKRFEKWIAWFKDLSAKGLLKDSGHPLEATGKVVKGKQKIVNDGPYAEAKDVVGGYMVIEADDLAHAVEISKGCPILEVDGSVEIRPIQPRCDREADNAGKKGAGKIEAVVRRRGCSRVLYSSSSGPPRALFAV
jgi:hypothetical protein